MTDNFIEGVIAIIIIVVAFLLGTALGNQATEERVEKEAVLAGHAEVINGEFKWKEPCK